MTTEQTFGPWDTGVIVCGCLTACAYKPGFINLARKWIFVAGHSVDQNNTHKKRISRYYHRKNHGYEPQSKL